MGSGAEVGRIKNKYNGLRFPYEMRLLDAKYADEIQGLQKEILGSLENPEVCVYLAEWEIEEILKGCGEMAGVFVNNGLVAFGASLFPGARQDNLGIDMGFTGDELLKVAHLEFAAVHPAYRGNSLQKKIAGYLVERIIACGQWDYVLNTVSPYNPVSLDTDFHLGFLIKRLSGKYGGIARYILIRYLKEAFKVDQESVISVQAADLARQAELLQEGYLGIGFENSANNGSLLYGKAVQG